jgi:hypothetical protein
MPHSSDNIEFDARDSWIIKVTAVLANFNGLPSGESRVSVITGVVPWVTVFTGIPLPASPL